MNLDFKCKSRLCMLFAVFVISQNLSGQYYCNASHEEKIEEIIEAIPLCYADRIGITEADLANIISPIINIAIDQDVAFPRPTVISTLTNHSFNWEIIPQANFYRVRAISLITGDQNYFITEETSFNFPVYTNELYLFLFSAVYAEEDDNYKSVDYIIIDEKPILEPELSKITKRPPRCSCDSNQLEPLGKRTSELESNPDLKMYPNPSDDFVYIEYYLKEKGMINLWLNDMTGKIVRQIQSVHAQESGFHQLEIAIDDLPSGLYHCVLQTKNGQAHSQILKK